MTSNTPPSTQIPVQDNGTGASAVASRTTSVQPSLPALQQQLAILESQLQALNNRTEKCQKADE